MKKLLKVLALTIVIVGMLELTTSCKSGWNCKKRYVSVR